MHISKLFVPNCRTYFAIFQCIQIRSLIINKSKEGVGLCERGAEMWVLALAVGRLRAGPEITLLNYIREVSGQGKEHAGLTSSREFLGIL